MSNIIIIIELKFWTMAYHTVQQFNDQNQKSSERTRTNKERPEMTRKDQEGSERIRMNPN